GRRSGGRRGSCIVGAMIGRPRVVRHLSCLLVLTVVSVGAAPAAWARKFSLPPLLEMARGNPGLQATAAASTASEAQVTEAKLNWLPQGDLLSIVAPSPNLHCSNPFWMTTATTPNPMNPAGTSPSEPCLETTSPEARITDVSWNRVFTRTEVKL